MRLSYQLQRDHESGDFGKALEGYSERVKAMEDRIESLERSKLKIGRIEARYPEFNKVLEIVEIVPTPNGLHIIVNP